MTTGGMGGGGGGGLGGGVMIQRAPESVTASSQTRSSLVFRETRNPLHFLYASAEVSLPISQHALSLNGRVFC